MVEFMHLVGTEEVGRAASRMQQAAESMQASISNLIFALDRNERFMDDWLERWKEVMQTLESKSEKKS